MDPLSPASIPSGRGSARAAGACVQHFRAGGRGVRCQKGKLCPKSIGVCWGSVEGRRSARNTAAELQCSPLATVETLLTPDKKRDSRSMKPGLSAAASAETAAAVESLLDSRARRLDCPPILDLHQVLFWVLGSKEMLLSSVLGSSSNSRNKTQAQNGQQLRANLMPLLLRAVVARDAFYICTKIRTALTAGPSVALSSGSLSFVLIHEGNSGNSHPCPRLPCQRACCFPSA
jgi:hypothetical protein